MDIFTVGCFRNKSLLKDNIKIDFMYDLNWIWLAS